MLALDTKHANIFGVEKHFSYVNSKSLDSMIAIWNVWLVFKGFGAVAEDNRLSHATLHMLNKDSASP